MLVLLVICGIFASSRLAESAYSPRIVGGQTAKIENFKWQAALLEDSTFFCGGSIISPTKILSAAHCTENIIYYNKLKARVGSTNPTAGGVIKSIVKIRSHPDYNRPTSMNNDIAIFFLGESLVFDATIGRIPLAGSSVSLSPGVSVVASGFGATTPESTKPDVLHSVSVPIVDYDQCYKAYKSYKGPGKLTKNMICAGFYGVGGKDACKGDSGGPLVYDSGGSGTILYGVISWGAKCGDPNYPGVYAKVSVYRDWINNAN
ncbi:trypsin alpha-3-like [Sitodiplosis mosellana]|uniref:trypsin alpha-3-like n=1 Tax=Sitodiplosis mosellana TaxID=263140 RepID=UPI002444F6B5|nr:trypsin alpha-3-like [Sitodiplosis mosellana]